MIDLTPLDVRKKRGDFRKGLRGYEAQEVDHFLELVAERLEEVVRENLTLKERAERLGQQVQGQEGRERAVQDALVTAQELREEIKDQAHREAEMIVREARSEAARIHAEVERTLQERRHELRELNRARSRFLKAFRILLERELDTVDVEEKATPEDDFELEAPARMNREAVDRSGSPPGGGTAADGDDPLSGGWPERLYGEGSEGESETPVPLDALLEEDDPDDDDLFADAPRRSPN